jgi:ABC-type transport system substrate-binding protein
MNFQALHAPSPRRAWLAALAASAAALLWAAAPAAAQTAPAAAKAAPKVLRYAFPIAETGMDPAQVSDLYSRILTANIFDALYAYDFLSRPVKVRPNVAAAMPEVSEDFKTWTVRIKPGIYFADDPAFKGQRRELTAQDFVYSYKRHYDPKTKSPSVYLLQLTKMEGLERLRAHALEGGKFDYDTEVDDLRALDRYTLQFKLGVPTPRFLYTLADPAVFGAVAREVVEFYGDKIMEHPVGTGPFRLAQWKRSSKIVFERNPNYRDERYDEAAPEGDKLSQQIALQLKGRKLPMIDRVEVSIIEEVQPRWLAFLGGEHDLLERLPNQFANIAIPNNQLAPNLAKKGIVMERVPLVDSVLSYFNMEHPLVGGYTPDKVALRRAIALAVNLDEEIRLARRNQMIPGQGPIAPLTFGYDPKLKTEMSDFSRARAKALLDMYGYVDRDGDGWRDLPDGRPLVLHYSTSPDATSRELNELWKKNMDAIGVKIEFKVAKWPENLKASRSGKLMMWGVAWSAGAPDGDTFLALGFGKNKGQANHSRFDLPQFDALYEKQRTMPDGPERFELMQQAAKLMVSYMPYKIHGHRFATDMTHPWVVGYRRHPFMREFWKYVDIDTSKLPK